MKRSNGEGTIYKRKDGRWCGSYYDNSPVPKRHSVYGKTQAEVKRKLKERPNNPEIETNKDTEYTLEMWLLFYLENYKKNEVKQTTFDSYMGIFKKHIKGSNVGSIKLKKITSNDLQRYYNAKIQDGYNAKTIKHIHILINSALNKAVQLKYVKENVNNLVSLPKRQVFNAKVLTVAEVNKIFEEAQEDSLYPIVVLTICTGLRKGEVMALTWDKINFDEKELYVEGSLCRVTSGKNAKGRNVYKDEILDPKTEKSKRTVPLIDKALEALKMQKKRQELQKEEYKDIFTDRGYVFTENDGSILHQRRFMDTYHEFLRNYGISDIRFHDLRHTFASVLLEAGESPKAIQELLGHSSITTTMDIYTHITKKAKVKTVETLDNLLNKKEGE